MDPRLQEANVDLSRAEALLARQPPSVTGLHSIGNSYFFIERGLNYFLLNTFQSALFH